MDDSLAQSRVLLVDDEPLVRRVGTRILEASGFAVTDIADGPEGIEAFEADPTAWTAVVLDLTLPTLDGLEVLQAIRAVRPDVPVVICSGWSACEVAEHVRPGPGTSYLGKPYTVEAMRSAIREAIGA